jgi:hypothetical protein
MKHNYLRIPLRIFGKKRAGSMISGGITPIYKLIGIAVGLAVIAVVAGLSILAAGTSAGLVSAISQINQFLVLIGLGIAISLFTGAFALAETYRNRR